MKATYLSSRILEYFLTFMMIVTLNFLLPRMMPGDPFLHLSAGGGEEIVVFTAEQRQYFLEYYGLDRPLPEQYVRYLTGLVKGDMGLSYYYRDQVLSIILRRLPWTLMVVTGATFFSLVLGVLMGSFSAWHRESWKDKTLYLTMIVFSEIPAFLLGIVLLIVFASGMGLFPLSGALTHFAGYTGWDKVKDVLYHAALPVITLSLARVGGIYLLVRNTFTTVLGKDYIRTARAKGLTEGRIRYYHALKNALLPL
ncbi:MAG: ABC transporter permease, partial [Firmicutes bacterium HGW-Firmicutes-13]